MHGKRLVFEIGFWLSLVCFRGVAQPCNTGLLHSYSRFLGVWLCRGASGVAGKVEWTAGGKSKRPCGLPERPGCIRATVWTEANGLDSPPEWSGLTVLGAANGIPFRRRQPLRARDTPDLLHGGADRARSLNAVALLAGCSFPRPSVALLGLNQTVGVQALFLGYGKRLVPMPADRRRHHVQSGSRGWRLRCHRLSNRNLRGWRGTAGAVTVTRLVYLCICASAAWRLPLLWMKANVLFPSPEWSGLTWPGVAGCGWWLNRDSVLGIRIAQLRSSGSKARSRRRLWCSKNHHQNG